MLKKEPFKVIENYEIKYEEMEYKYNPYNTSKILMQGKYRNYQFYILSFGTHPTAYVEIPKGHKLYGKDYNQIYYMGIDIDVHGGLTYSHSCLRDIKHDSWFIGWDYAHYGDYFEIPSYKVFDLNDGSKKWTTLEIFEDVKTCIDTIRKESLNGILE